MLGSSVQTLQDCDPGIYEAGVDLDKVLAWRRYVHSFSHLFTFLQKNDRIQIVLACDNLYCSCPVSIAKTVHHYTHSPCVVIART